MSTPIGAPGGEAYWAEDESPVINLEIGLGELLDLAVREAPDREALVFLERPDGQAVRMTYTALSRQVDEAVAALLAAEVRRDGTVAFYSTNRPEFEILQLACARIGAAVVPVNPLYSPDSLGYVLSASGAELCFVGDLARGPDLADRLEEVRVSSTNLRGCVSIGANTRYVRWEEWMAAGSRVAPQQVEDAMRNADIEDVAEIQFTSGTTGRPKAVQLSSSALANGGRRCAHRSDLEDGCRYAHGMPFFHVGGTVTAMTSIMAARGTHIFLPSFSPAGLCRAIEQEKATIILAVPTMMISLAEQAESDDSRFSDLRVVVTGGALVPEQVARRWVDTFGVGISNTYGMTEICGPAVQTSPLDPLDRALQSVGRPLPGVEVDVVEVGTENRVAIGEPGEIRFRGPALMKGYLGDPEATAAAISHDRWLRSGDIGVLGPDGFVEVTGRAKDLIIRGGENIAPATIEDAIRENVDEVLDAAVIGVPDDYYGEVVAAYLRMKDPSASICREELAERLDGHLPRFMLPAHVRVVTEFPATPSGKVQKFRLREMFDAEG